MNRSIRIVTLLTIGAAIILGGCYGRGESRPVQQRDGESYGTTSGTFRYRWWNYLERGNSFASGQFWSEAIADYQEALRQRNVDTNRARTYGMHFVRYFPNREIGIAYLNTGQLDLAIASLDKSMAQAPTAKAQFFLHDAWRAQLAQKKELDRAAPTLVLTTPEADTMSAYRLMVRGTVEDDRFIDRLVVNGKDVSIDRAQKKLDFECPVELSGKTDVTVEAYDLTGKKTVQTLALVQDVTGPMLSISSPRIGSSLTDAKVVMTGTVMDEGGLSMLEVAGTSFTLNGQKKHDFSVPVTLRDGRNAIEFHAIDRAGNRTEGKIPYVRVSSEDGMLSRYRLYAKAPEEGGDILSGATNGATGKPEVDVVNLRNGQTIPYRPPSVVANGGTYVLQVNVTGGQVISKVTVNDTAITPPPMTSVFFTQRIPIREGDMKVTIEAADKTGATTVKELVVKAEMVKVFDEQSRLALAPLPFKNALEEKAKLRSMVMDSKLVDGLLRGKRFRLVDRSKDALDTFVKEQQVAQTDFVDKDKAIAIGKLLNAEYLLTGTIVEDAGGAEILGRIVNVATSEIVATPQVYGPASSLAEAGKLAEDLALAVAQELPLLSGEVKVKGGKMAISIGEMAHLRPNAPIIIFRPDPDWGDEAPPLLVGKAEVERIGAKLSFIRTTTLEADMTVEDGDQFVTR